MNRRSALRGFLAAPAIIRSPGPLMPIRPLALSPWRQEVMDLTEASLEAMRLMIAVEFGLPQRLLFGESHPLPAA
jgi:hypothetical protein